MTAVLALALAGLALSACGSTSAGSTAPTAGASASKSAKRAVVTRRDAGKIRECLQLNGAAKKCGLLRGSPATSPAKGTLASFTACLRASGVNVHELNPSGTGLASTAKSTPAKLRAVEVRCAETVGALRGQWGAGRAP